MSSKCSTCSRKCSFVNYLNSRKVALYNSGCCVMCIASDIQLQAPLLAQPPEPLNIGGEGGLDAALLLIVAVAGRAAESGGGWQDPCDRGPLSGHVPVPHGGLHQCLRRPFAQLLIADDRR